jgi:hypothetical protein
LLVIEAGIGLASAAGRTAGALRVDLQLRGWEVYNYHQVRFCIALLRTHEIQLFEGHKHKKNPSSSLTSRFRARRAPAAPVIFSNVLETQPSAPLPPPSTKTPDPGAPSRPPTVAPHGPSMAIPRRRRPLPGLFRAPLPLLPAAASPAAPVPVRPPPAATPASSLPVRPPPAAAAADVGPTGSWAA